MSHEESQPKADLMFNELITYNCLSGDLQTAGVLTAGIVTPPKSWLVFDTYVHTFGKKKKILTDCTGVKKC